MDWRTANIMLIFKNKGTCTDRAYYRPISLILVVCKLMESMIKDKLVGYIDRNDIISKHQHGFMQQRSCLTNLLEALESWTDALDNG